MAEIWGTPRADELVGTDGNDLIRGGRGEDRIYGGTGDDILYGGMGNDYIEDRSGRSEISGGYGSDLISFVSGVAYGGRGNDRIVCGDESWATDGAPGAAIVGGVGNDTMRGAGWLFGDQSPGMAAQPGGNDKLTLVSDTDGVWANGGLGRDTFTVERGDGCFAVIDDFHASEDKLFAVDNSHDQPVNLFGYLDTNGNGILEGNDDAIDTDGTNLFIDLNLNDLSGHGSDEPSWLTLNNVTQVSAADWLFPDWAA